MPKFDAIPDTIQFDAVPDAEPFDAIPDTIDPVAEGQKASMGALQALDVMAAPRSLDWSDVATRLNSERAGQAYLDEQAAREKFRLGQISEPEMMAALRSSDEARGITPEQRQQEIIAQDQRSAQSRMGEIGTPAQMLSQFLGPGLSSTAMPVIESAARNTGSAIGGAGGAAMFMAPAAGPAGILFPMIGGMMGSITGGMGQEGLLRSTETPEETQARQDRATQAESESPIASGIGAMASNLPFFRPSPSMVGRALTGQRSALKNVGAAGGIGAGAEIAASIVGGQPLTLQSIATAALSNAFMSEPTRLGRRMGFPASPVEVADTISVPIREVPEIQIESGLSTRPTTSTADVFANIRKPGEQNAQQISETGTTVGDAAGESATPFVNDKSKVVEKVYHGTRSLQPFARRSPMVNGYYFAREKGTAEKYAQNWSRGKGDPQVIEAYINIENPAPWDTVQEWRNELGDGDKLREKLLSLGYDGIITPEEFVVFNKEQIKTIERGENEAPSGQGEPLAQNAPEAPREVAPEPTGIRNSIVDARRRTAQMEAREIPARREFGTILDEAKSIQAKDPDAAIRLVDDLKENVRPLTDTEDALLTVEQNRRELAREEAIDEVNSATDEESRDAALAKLAFAENKAFEVYQVGQNAGTANARGLNARRLMIQQDYSLAKMLNETRALRNSGEPLSEAQTNEITALHSRIADLEGKLSNKESRDAQRVARQEYQDLLRATKQEAQVAAKEKKSVVDFFEAQAQKARERIIARRGRLQVTVDPLNIAGLVDEAIIGASHVARGVRDFAQWSKEMLKEFGERVRPHLEPLFARAQELEAENAGAFKTKDTRNPQEVLANAKGLDRALITDLARAHINQGVEGFEQVIGAVENDLKTQFPDVTTRQIHDALSGYGKVTKPSQAEDLKKLREYRSLARLTSQLEDAQKGLNPLKTGPQRDKATARVRELQKQVNDAMEAAGLKRTREDQLASSLDAAKTRIKNATEELQRKIDRNDYTERPKREQQVDQERINLEFDLAKVKQEYQKGLIEARRARRTTGEKIWDTTKETFNLSRQLLTSGDLPPVFRQGLFSIGRPKMAAKALKDSLMAMVSEKKRFAIDREIQNRENAPLYQRAKLYLAKDTGQTLSQQEEAYMGNWFKELPRWTVVGPFLRASERSYNTFLNKLRADTFDAAVKAYEIAPTDTKDLRALADVINTMTGRAKLPGKALEQGAGALNTFLFAPRFLASRFKLATGQPLWSGTGKSRKFALEQYARTLSGAALIYGLAKMAGAEIETDPRSTDFGKIRFGNTRLDPLGGLSQITTFLTRVTTGETKGKEGVKPLREGMRPLPVIDQALGTNMAARGKASKAGMGAMIGSFMRTKLNPVAGAAVDVATGKDVTGKPVTPGGLAIRMTAPISFQDIAETMQEQGVPKGTAMWILSLFGMGLQTYGKRQ